MINGPESRLVVHEGHEWARQADLAGAPGDWITFYDAARRLAMSPSWFRRMAREMGIEIRRQGRRPGVSWADVEAYIAQSRITRCGEASSAHERPMTDG